VNVDDLAARLIAAADARTGIEALTTSVGTFDVETAYAVQDALVADRVARGNQVVGAKLGLTSVAKQKQMNVDEPIYGWLTADMTLDADGSLECARFIQPRCEPEIAFRLGTDLRGENATAEDVLAATEAVFPAIDVLDSRYAGYSFTLPDVAADNASGAGYLVGADGVDPSGFDLRLTGVVLSKNGELVATATGAEVLGHPAASVAWLVRALAARGRGLTAGQVVLSGALTAAVAVQPGDVITAEFDRLGALEVRCR
jgi:2-keto-4-pentenoate hydratase